jgi:hypothetical protein
MVVPFNKRATSGLLPLIIAKAACDLELIICFLSYDMKFSFQPMHVALHTVAFVVSQQV